MLLLPMLYLPPVSYMALLSVAGEVRIEAQEHYIKSTYRNRCEILGANGLISLSIPLQGGRDHHQLYRDTRISYTDHWQHKHLMSIMSGYGSAPFFEHYAEYFEPFYTEHYETLFEFNKELFMLIIKLMKLNVKISYTDTFEKVSDGETDLRQLFRPSKAITELAVGEKKWHLCEVPYIQVFGAIDVVSAQVSCLDLLFNTGPEAKTILKQMVKIS